MASLKALRVVAEAILASQSSEDFTLWTTSLGSPTRGEGYVRFSYANSVENIEAALDKAGKVLAG
jgi:hypothetical protein